MKRNKKIIGLTGSIATGKSQVTSVLKELDIKVIDADEIAKEVLKKEDIQNEIEKKLNHKFREKEEFKKELLSKYVFEDTKRLEILNSITHKEIFKRINEEIENSMDQVIVVDIPLLIEINDKLKEYNFKYDYLWLVYANEKTQLERLMKRDNISKEEAMKKIKSQISINKKRKVADVVLYNDGTKKELMFQIVKHLNLTKL